MPFMLIIDSKFPFLDLKTFTFYLKTISDFVGSFPGLTCILIIRTDSLTLAGCWFVTKMLTITDLLIKLGSTVPLNTIEGNNIKQK